MLGVDPPSNKSCLEALGRRDEQVVDARVNEGEGQ